MSWATITIRKMRDVNEWVPCAAAKFTQIPLFFLFMVVCDNDLWLWTRFGLFDYFIIFSSGLFSILSQTFLFKALRNHSASALQPYSFLRPLQQFLTDIMFFNLTYSGKQIFGISLLISVYLVKFSYNFYVSRKK